MSEVTPRQYLTGQALNALLASGLDGDRAVNAAVELANRTLAKLKTEGDLYNKQRTTRREDVRDE